MDIKPLTEEETKQIRYLSLEVRGKVQQRIDDKNNLSKLIMEQGIVGKMI